jgi:hypothetical protein
MQILSGGDDRCKLLVTVNEKFFLPQLTTSFTVIADPDLHFCKSKIYVLTVNIARIQNTY